MPNFINDEYMSYEVDTHKYYLTVEGYEHYSGEALTADHGLDYEQSLRMLKRVSNIVYQFVYSWSQDPSRTEYEISLPAYRDCIRDALVEMMTALLANKTDMGLYFTDKSVETVTPQVKLILMNGGVLTRCKLPFIPDYDEKRGVDY